MILIVNDRRVHSYIMLLRDSFVASNNFRVFCTYDCMYRKCQRNEDCENVERSVRLQSYNVHTLVIL